MSVPANTQGADGYTLGIDLGTTATCAAVRQGDQIRILQIDGNPKLSSAVYLDDDGELLVGRAAESRAAVAPERFEPTPKRYIEAGEEGILLGDRYLPIAQVVGAVLRVVWNEVLLQHEGRQPDEVRLTHPASWQADRRQLLRDAAAEAGIGEVTMLPEPEAAAIGLAREDAGAALGQGARTMVFDLGGGTFDVTVLQRTGNRFKVTGESGGSDGNGGEVYDTLLHEELGRTGLPADVWERLQTSDEVEWTRANHEFRRSVREAKEAVSKVAAQPIVVPAPVSRELQVTRDGLERLIRPYVEQAIEIAAITLARAGMSASQLSAIYLVGGSSRIPLVLHLVRERFGQAHFRGDPKTVVAQGAVAFESALVAPAPAPEKAPAKRRPWWFVPGVVSGAALVVALLFVLTVGGTKTLSGRVLDSQGDPVEGLEVQVVAQLMGDSKSWTATTDDDGVWEVRGDAEKMSVLGVTAYADLPYQDTVWSYQLVPLYDDADPDYHALDFQIRIDGAIDESSELLYGGTVYVEEAVVEDGDSTIALSDAAGPGAVLTLYFTPIGPRLDGTEAEEYVFELPVESLDASDDLQDIPVGPYEVRGDVTRADGTQFAVVFEDLDDELYETALVDFWDTPTDTGYESLYVTPDPAALGSVEVYDEYEDVY